MTERIYIVAALLLLTTPAQAAQARKTAQRGATVEADVAAEMTQDLPGEVRAAGGCQGGPAP